MASRKLSRKKIWSSIQSPAKTAYGHLSWVRKLILEEPKRYNQHIWLIGRGIEPEPWSQPMQKQIESNAPQGLPQCGTVACVAGWVVASTSQRYPRNQLRIAAKAQELLGLTDTQADELFDGGAIYELWDGPPWYESPRPQTAKFAALGAQHIANFQQKYAAQLKRTKLKRPHVK